jgi:hypothetical protein
MMIALTGSRFGSLCYLVQRRNYQEAFQLLWDIKYNRIPRRIKDPCRSFAIRWGIRTEDEALRQFQQIYGWPLEEQDTTQWLEDVKVFDRRVGARSDGTYTDNNGVRGVLEIKCPLHNPHAQVPAYYMIQMYFEMKAYNVHEGCFITYYHPRGWQEYLTKSSGDERTKEQRRTRTLVGPDKRKWKNWISNPSTPPPSTPMPFILRAWRIKWDQDMWNLIVHMMTLIGQWGDDPSQEQASVLKAHIKKVNASLDTLKPEPLHVPYEAPETRKRPPTPRRSARIRSNKEH